MKWYTERPDGAYQHPGPSGRISQAGRVALAVTEACQKRRRGKVYVLAPYRASNSDESNDNVLLEKLGHIPELVFVPEVWTDSEVQEWRKASWQVQWQCIGARSGWLEDHVPVLPLGFILPEHQERKHLTPASVQVVMSLGKRIVLIIKGTARPAENMMDMLDMLERAYWTGGDVVFLGTLLDEFVACDNLV